MHIRRYTQIALIALLVAMPYLLPLAGCGDPQSNMRADQPPQQSAKTSSTTPPPTNPHAADSSLHNVYRVSDRIVSGALPDNDAAFAELAQMGIRTVISVDGGTPDIEAAHRYDMRYVHIPVGYHGLTQKQQLTLAKAVKEMPGPVYVHCHHGKHRGPAAAASAAVLLGEMSADDGVAFMKQAGTSDHYTGLYGCVAGAQTADADAITSLEVDLPEVAPMPDFVKAMSHMQESYDRLDELRKADWIAPAHHPDLQGEVEIGQIVRLLEGLVANPEGKQRPEDYTTMLSDCLSAARRFSDSMKGSDNGRAADSQSTLAKQLDAINASCKACHVVYRDRVW